MEGPSMARKSGCKRLKVRQTGEEKKGVSPGDYGLYDAVIWGLFKSHLCPSGRGGFSHAGAGSAETEAFQDRLTSATVAGPNYLIAFLLLHGGLYRPAEWRQSALT